MGPLLQVRSPRQLNNEDQPRNVGYYLGVAFKMPFQCCTENGDSTYGLANHNSGHHFHKRGQKGLLQLQRNHTF